MKATLYDISGKKKKEIELPSLFDTSVRQDIVAKYVEADRYFQPHSLHPEAGKRHSASGTISHKRHDWKGQYGKGISRTPRKALWRRGVQFNWVGAEVSNTRGGRRPHSSQGIRRIRKMNQKEAKLAFNSAFAATAKGMYLVERYGRVTKAPASLPFVIESKIENIKSKEIFMGLKAMLGDLFELALSRKAVRAGKGKLRGRRYKMSAGLLLVTGSKESVKLSGIQVTPVSELVISDLYPLGRLTVYTEKALEELAK